MSGLHYELKMRRDEARYCRMRIRVYLQLDVERAERMSLSEMVDAVVARAKSLEVQPQERKANA